MPVVLPRSMTATPLSGKECMGIGQPPRRKRYNRPQPRVSPRAGKANLPVPENHDWRRPLTRAWAGTARCSQSHRLCADPRPCAAQTAAGPCSLIIGTTSANSATVIWRTRCALIADDSPERSVRSERNLYFLPNLVYGTVTMNCITMDDIGRNALAVPRRSDIV